MRTLLGLTALVGAGIVALMACSSDATPATGTNPDGGKSSSGGTSSGGGSVSTALNGDWDLIATDDDGRASHGSLTVTATTFSISIGSTKLEYKVDGTTGTLVQTRGSRVANLTVQRGTGTFDTGAFPLPLGGDWTVSDDSAKSNKCTGALGTDSSVTCNHADLPEPFPNPQDGHAYTGKRTSSTTSVFGDLGGEWTFTTEGAGDDACAASFTGNKVHLQCSQVKELAGTVDLTFASDLQSLSGNSSGDFELSGQKK